jgi:hypothetical protein
LIDRTRKEREWGVDRTTLLAGLQAYVDRCVGPVWGVSAELRWAADFAPGAWALVFVDEVARATLGYHQLTAAGFPMGVVPVGAVRRARKSISSLAAHELAEMLVDPAGNVLVQRPGGRLYALEICDPVKDLTYTVDRIEVANFVFPGWFLMAGTWRYRAPDGRLDWMGSLRRPFELHPAGYATTVIGGQWRRQRA